MKRRMIISVIGAVLVALIAGILWLYSASGKSYVLSKIITAAEDATGYEIAIEKLVTNYVSKASLITIRIRDDATGGSAYINRISINYSLFPLFRTTVQIDSLISSSLDITLNNRMLKAFSGQKSSATGIGGGRGWKFQLGYIQVVDANLTYSHPELPLYIRLKGTDVHYAVGDTFHTSIQSLDSVAYKSSVINQATLEVYGRHSSSGLSISNLMLQSPTSKLRSSGSIESQAGGNAVRGDVEAHLARDFTDFLKVFLPEALKQKLHTDSLSLQGSVDITPAEIAYRGKVQAPGAVFDTLQVQNLRAEFSGSTDSLQISQFYTELPSGLDTIRLHGTFDWQQKFIRLDVVSFLSSTEYVQQMLRMENYPLDTPVEIRFSGMIPYENLSRAAGQGRILLVKPQYNVHELSHVLADFRIRGGEIRLEVIQRTPADVNRIALVGRCDWPMEFTGTLQLADISEINTGISTAFTPRLSSTFQGTIGDQGDPIKLSGRMQAHLNYRFMELPVDIQLAYAWQGDTLILDEGELAVSSLTPAQVSGKVRFSPSLSAELVVDEPAIPQPDTDRPLSGKILLRISSKFDKSLQSSLDISNVSLSRWGAVIPRMKYDLQGIVNSKNNLLMTPDSITGGGNLSVQGVRFGLTSIDSASLDYSVQKEGITVERGMAVSRTRTIAAEIRGFLPFDSSNVLDVQASGHNWPIDLLNPFLPPSWDVDGTITPSVRITGYYDRPSITGGIRIDSGYVQWQDTKPPVEALNGEIIFQGKQFEIRKLAFRYQSYPIDITGKGTLEPDFQGKIYVRPAGEISIFYARESDTASVQMLDIPLQILQDHIPENYTASGALTADFQAAGVIENRLSLNSRGYLLPTMNPTPLDWKIDWNVAYSENQITLRHFACAADSGNMTITGQLPLSALVNNDSTASSSGDSASVAFSLANFPISIINQFTSLVRANSGRLNADVYLSGGLEAPNIQGSLRGTDIALNNPLRKWQTSRGQLHIEFQNERTLIRQFATYINDYSITLDGKFEYDRGQYLQAGISGSFNETAPFRVNLYHDEATDSLEGHLSVSSIPLSQFLTMLKTPREIQGQLNLSLRLSGSRQKPTLIMNGQADNLSFGELAFPEAHFRSHYSNQQFVLDTLLVSNAASFVRGTGNISAIFDLDTFSLGLIGEEIFLSLQARGFALESLGALSGRDYNISGDLSADMAYRKTVPGGSSIQGSVEITGFESDLPYFEQHLRNGHFRADFTGSTIRLINMHVDIDENPLTISGSIDIVPHAPLQYDITVHSEQFDLTRPGEVAITIAPSKLRITTTSGQTSLLTGNIIVASFTYTKPIHNLQPLSFIGTRTVRPPRLPQQMFQNIQLNVAIQALKNIKVNNNLASLDFTADVQSTGPLFQPRFTGRIVAEKGYIKYVGRNFQIENGTVLFTGGPELNPTLDIQATTTIPAYQNVDDIDYTIVLNITNTLRNPQVRFASKPATRPHTNESLTQSDILGILAVGRPRDQFSGVSGEGNLSQFFIRQASRISSEKIASVVEYRVGRLFDLDRVAIEGNLFQLSGRHTPTFTAAKSISPRLTLTYSTSIGQSNQQGIRINYELSDHWYLVTETNQEQRYGLDLKYRIRFK